MLFDEKIVAIERALVDAAIPHAFGGANALAYYATPRATADIDLNVFVPASRAVRVLGAGESHTHWNISQMPDLTRSAAAISGREAFGMAGVTPDDVDIFEPYDSFTITVLLQLEDLGFCKKGEAGAFVEGGRLRPGGDLPGLTSGGGLSYNHPGALGLLLVIEAVRQLRGEAGERQVPGAKIAAVNGVGGLFSVSGTAVLARD